MANFRSFFKPKRDDIIHSHGLANVSNNSNLGSTSSETYATRQSTEANRQHVAGYDQSGVVHAYRADAKRPVPVSARIDIVKPMRQTGNLGARPSNFSEPSPRGYNPYR